MRRRLATATVLALAVTGAGCGSDQDPSSSDEAATDSIDGVTVTGEFGDEATLEVDGLEVSGPESAVLIDGDGAEVAAEDTVSYRILLAKGTDGSTIQSNYKSNTPETSPIEQLPESVKDAVVGQMIGSRVLVAMPTKELVCGPDPAADCTGDATQLDLKGDDPVVVVLDLLEQALEPLTGPEGTSVEPPADAPKVVEEDGAVTGIDFSDAPAKAPKKFEVIPLIEGDGPTVEENTSITVDYYGAVWGEDKPFDESFSGEPATFTLAEGSLIDGWVEGLAGVKAGSRVMLVIPADMGYGAQGSPPSIPPNATLVFVVDVLGAGG